jgi:hypothetical protein
LASNGCQRLSIAKPDKVIGRMLMVRVISVLVFIGLLFSDFIDGVVEREHDVLA